MTEPKEPDDAVKLAIEEELSSIERAAHDILSSCGIDWNEELSNCATTFRESVKIFPEFPNIQSMPHAMVFPMYAAIGLCRAGLRYGDKFPDGGYSEAIGLLCVASRALGGLTAWHAVSEQANSALVRDLLGKVAAVQARRAARARVAIDPKQAEKLFVEQCWKEWRQQPARYKSKAAFARDMLDKCTHLKSQKKIEDWCRDFEKGTEPAE